MRFNILFLRKGGGGGGGWAKARQDELRGGAREREFTADDDVTTHTYVKAVLKNQMGPASEMHQTMYTERATTHVFLS